MANYALRQDSSHLMISPRHDALTLRLSGIQLAFEFDFRVWSEPTWLKDAGTGSLSAFNTDFNIDLVLRASPLGGLEVTSAHAAIDTRDYDVQLHGQSDLSRALQQALAGFRVFFEQELQRLLTSRLTTLTQQLFYEKISAPPSALEVQTMLLCDPVFEPTYLAFVLEQTFESQSTGPKPASFYPKLPLLLADESNALTHS